MESIIAVKPEGDAKDHVTLGFLHEDQEFSLLNEGA